MAEGSVRVVISFFFFQAEDGIRDSSVTGVQTCALPILEAAESAEAEMAKSTTLVGGDREAQSFLSPETLRLAISESAEDAGEVLAYATRSEERRVGKEGRSRWSPDH